MAETGSKQQTGFTAGLTRYRVTVKGIVQGVGFRPFIYNLAVALGLKGSVLNSGRGVIIDVEGDTGIIKLFMKELEANPPRLARVISIEREELEPRGYRTFEILFSRSDNQREALVPPDVALCGQCHQDVLNRRDRHYRYPFTNCTNCGPRFTIVRDLPYDRKATSMGGFPMCQNCRAEYKNPGDRRFHAQPVACPRCGPQVTLVTSQGAPIKGDWLIRFKQLIKDGKIGAIKGLGGFHLVCDAANSDAIHALRERKRRPAKPFAVMCRDLETVKKYCFVDEEEEEVLTAPEAPIVILHKRVDILPRGLAPGLATLGVMLPYTPLHLLLFDDQVDVLVMTSGNYSDLPLAKDNEEALEQLGSIADFFLLHNRDIINRCDDSLVRVIEKEPHLLRRSRGYVPRGIRVPVQKNGPVILGMGGEMKNTFCLLKGKQAFLSQYIGEMDSLESEKNFLDSLDRFSKLIKAQPTIVAHDLHPNYRTTELAQTIPAEQRCAVQHHHAHFVSCLTENEKTGPALGVIIDGTGYGADGCVWGFEILSGDYSSYERLYHLKYLPLPAGEAAVKNPWMMAVAYLHNYIGDAGRQVVEKLLPEKENKLDFCWQVLGSNFNSPLTSSGGRLFDAVSSLLGICHQNSYEGQAAVELSELLPRTIQHGVKPYPFTIRGQEIDPGETIKNILDDLLGEASREQIALKFHHTAARMIVEAVQAAAEQTGTAEVALSGGVWQNRYLFLLTKDLLEKEGLSVLYHRQVPCNDGGISLGQSVVAHWRWRKNVSGNTC